MTIIIQFTFFNKYPGSLNPVIKKKIFVKANITKFNMDNVTRTFKSRIDYIL
jgi:hypothetical protein